MKDDHGHHLSDQPRVKAPERGLNAKLRWRRRCWELRWGAWNVRTFSSKVKVSGTGELMVEGDLEKPEEFCRIMEEANLSLCCNSELRWKGAGEVRVGTHTVLFSGLDEAAPKSEHGVGIVRNGEMYTAWNERILFASLGVEDYSE